MSDLVSVVRACLSQREPRRGPAGLRPAAVLLPVLVSASGHRLILTVRARGLRRQPGDISFPGGVLEPADATPLDAALRESREEIGLRSEDVQLLGQMDERGTITGFRITPFVGAVEHPYTFRPNHEVGAVLEVPIEELRRPDVLYVEKRRLRDGRERDVYHYRYGEHDIWGITGRLVRDFLALIGGSA
jgi:8-oxo-dGTP pyrophosphatase MutT (NUDIX family)